MVRFPTVGERTQTAEVVLVGTVVSLEGDQPYNQVAVVDVESYLKGGGEAGQVQISGFGEPSLCKSRVVAGQRYIFFANGGSGSADLPAHYSPWRNAAREVSGGGQINAVAIPSDESIAAVLAVSGQTLQTPESGDTSLLLFAALAAFVGALALAAPQTAFAAAS
jgi:hypothetical protein